MAGGTMRFIGITGGVGAGKTQILSYLSTKPAVRVMLADEIAHELMEPGTACYERIRDCFGQEDIWLSDGRFDRTKLAAVIFADDGKRKTLNDIVHPAVKEYVRQQAQSERRRGELRLLVLEAALLIEEHYDEICDELWYINTDSNIRRARLKESRGYSDEKVDQIFASQLSDVVYRNACTVMIDNNGPVEDTLVQIDELLRRVTDE
jgi:dephospho-CoA kinase